MEFKTLDEATSALAKEPRAYWDKNHDVLESAGCEAAYMNGVVVGMRVIEEGLRLAAYFKEEVKQFTLPEGTTLQ